MKNVVLIFNYNYAHFMHACISSLASIFNDPSYTILILDDGSSDDSYSVYEDFKSKHELNNLIFERVRPYDSGRRMFPSHGQIEALEIFFHRYQLIGTEYIHLLDSDDYYGSEISELTDDLSAYDVIFLKVQNVNLEKNLKQEFKIKRAVTDGVSYMWPSIVPTSGLVVRASFLKKHFKSIVSKQPLFHDIWIDLRINICAMHYETKAFYSQKMVIRRLHAVNDSSSGGIKRLIQRQISALKFRNYIPNIPPCSFSGRYLVTYLALITFELITNIKLKLKR